MRLTHENAFLELNIQSLIDGNGFSVLHMTKLVVAKFGGSAIGEDGLSIPIIIQRITELKKDSKLHWSKMLTPAPIGTDSG